MNRKHNPWVSLTALLLLAVILVMACTGCRAAEGEAQEAQPRFTAESYRLGGPAYTCCMVVTDNETGVQYLVVGYRQGAGVTPLLEP